MLGLDVAGDAWLLLVVAVVDAVLGTALGLFLSAFAATEFQAVQFLPAFVLPQFLLCGLLVPRDQLPDVLHWISRPPAAVLRRRRHADDHLRPARWRGRRPRHGVVLAFVVARWQREPRRCAGGPP